MANEDDPHRPVSSDSALSMSDDRVRPEGRHDAPENSNEADPTLSGVASSAGNYLGGDYARDRSAAGFGGDYARDPNAPGSAVDRNAYARDDMSTNPSPRGPLARRESFRGRGPKSYRRSDDRIRDDVSDVFTEDHDLDATHIEVAVTDGEVTLTGTLASRWQKRHATDLAERCAGVHDVHNNITIADGSPGGNHDLLPTRG